MFHEAKQDKGGAKPDDQKQTLHMQLRQEPDISKPAWHFA